LFYKHGNSQLDFVSNFTNCLNVLPFGVRERPIVANQPRYVGTVIPAAHRNQHFRTVGKLGRELLRSCPG